MQSSFIDSYFLAGTLLGLIVFSVLASVAWGRFIGPLKELDSYESDGNAMQEAPSVATQSDEIRAKRDALEKAEARLQAHRDADDLDFVARDRIRLFNNGIYESMLAKPKSAVSVEPSDFEIYSRARAAARASCTRTKEIWVLPAGGCTEAQMTAVAKIIDAQGAGA
jgi:hypothetical protein